MNINNFLYTFCLSDREFLELSNHIEFGNQYISFSENTDCLCHSESGNSLCIIGLCVDAYGELNREDIPKYAYKGFVSSSRNDFSDLLFLDRFAGKFVILLKIADLTYVFTDPSASLTIYYNMNSNIVASSEKIIAQLFNLDMSERNVKIRKSSDLSTPLPNDVTNYEQIKVLLPNHYRIMQKKCNVRFFPNNQSIYKNIKVEQAVDYTVKLATNILTQFNIYTKQVFCPLTSGYDSRVIFALLSKNIVNLKCYTYYHKGYTETSGDYYIASKLANFSGNQHNKIDIIRAKEEDYHYLREYISEYINIDNVNLISSLRESHGKSTIYEGDIIDQIGKTLIGQNLNERHATASFLTCKTHNYDRETVKEIKKWKSDINVTKFSIFDLFSWENRLARYVAQTAQIHSAYEINSLNFFNNRAIIKSWMQVDRKSRKNMNIHKEIIKTINGNLLQFEFNPDSKTDWMKKNNVLFLIGTYTKFYRDKLKYLLRRKI
jgi:hypothetical protein